MVLREILTPHATYSSEERDAFYRSMVGIGALLVSQGVPVIFDATANRRVYRSAARSAIEHFIEVHVDCPLEACTVRDPKGIYHKAISGDASTVPGAQSSYEPPEHPEAVVSGTDDVQLAAHAIVKVLKARGCLPPARVAPHW